MMIAGTVTQQILLHANLCQMKKNTPQVTSPKCCPVNVAVCWYDKITCLSWSYFLV